MTDVRSKVRAFLALPFRRQHAIATELGVVEARDRGLTDDETIRVWFQRVKDRGQTEQLFALIDREAVK